MMKNTTMRAALLVAMLAASVLFAGTLDPPGPPAPTMVTLQEIYNRISASAAAVSRTGQTGCWDATGIPIGCAGTGQDGEHQKGTSATPRFADNGDGTVRDNLTGLIWVKDATCFGLRSWSQALTDANGLASGACGLTDGSGAGTWRLPNAREQRSLLDFGRSNPALPAGHPFTGVVSTYYWSSTTYMATSQQTFAMAVNFSLGYVGPDAKSGSWYVWPVRGGQ